jgi:Holin of 3TMs, for gene-transfer release
MFAVITSLLGLADPISRIAGKIADARIASVQASTDKEKIEQEERVKALEARRDVLKAESDGRVNGVIRALLAVPVIVFLWKVIIWDKVLALGSTDDLSENLWYVTMMVLGFYYVHWTVGRLKR